MKNNIFCYILYKYNMGNCTSSQIKLNTKIHIENNNIEQQEDNIDIDILYIALFKLQVVFDINNTAINQLIKIIYDVNTKSFQDIFLTVKKYISYKLGLRLSVNEITNLIRFIKLYEEEKDANLSYLRCPYYSELPVWSAEIRRQELSRSIILYSNTHSNLSTLITPNDTIRSNTNTDRFTRSSSYYSLECN